jgi:hypothetical protein
VRCDRWMQTALVRLTLMSAFTMAFALHKCCQSIYCCIRRSHPRDACRFLNWWKGDRKGGLNFESQIATTSTAQPRRPRKLTMQESRGQMVMLASRDDFDDNLRNIFVRRQITLRSPSLFSRA